MFKPVKKSLRLSADTVAVIQKGRSSTDINWSRSINNMVTRYRLFVELAMPKITNQELTTVAMCYGGRAINDQDIKHEIDMLHLQVQKGIYDPLASNFLLTLGFKNQSELEAFRGDLQKKSNGWCEVERLAVLHHIEEHHKAATASGNNNDTGI